MFFPFVFRLQGGLGDLGQTQQGCTRGAEVAAASLLQGVQHSGEDEAHAMYSNRRGLHVCAVPRGPLK